MKNLFIFLCSCLIVSGCEIEELPTCYQAQDRVINKCDLDGPTTAITTDLRETDKRLTLILQEATTGNYQLRLGDVTDCAGLVDVNITVNGIEIENSIQQSFPKNISFSVQGTQSVQIVLEPDSLDQNCLCPDSDPVIGAINGEFKVNVVVRKI